METLQDWITLLAGAVAAIWAWVKRENLLVLLSAAAPAVKAAGTAAVEAATTSHDEPDQEPSIPAAVTPDEAQAAADTLRRWHDEQAARRAEVAKTLPPTILAKEAVQ